MKRRSITMGSVQDWSTLVQGQTVEIRRHGVIEVRGIVDAAAPDGSCLWLVLEGALGRRQFRSAENIRVHLSSPM